VEFWVGARNYFLEVGGTGETSILDDSPDLGEVRVGAIPGESESLFSDSTAILNCSTYLLISSRHLNAKRSWLPTPFRL
jgi:hypothetical protein